MISLQNEYIQAKFSSKGAELQEFKDAETGYEYLWSGDPQYWGKFSPVLFPIVGGLKDNTYYFGDREYHLPRHGFARDKEFKAVQVTADEVWFSLEDDEETLKSYPFKFKLAIGYKISGKQLSCTYRMTNPGDKDMYFSVGAHPAFAVHTDEGLNYSDYYLLFNQDTELVRHKIGSDLITDHTETIQMENQMLPLRHELFYDDALVMKGLNSDRISLRNHKDDHGLDFDFKGFPFFGIWAAKDADFVCLEPWCGIADGTDHNQILLDKEGINQLDPESIWERSWAVTVF